MKIAFSTTFLMLIAIAGLIPFILMIAEHDFGNDSVLSTMDAYLTKPTGGIVYAILFASGAFIALQIRSAFWVICLVPALLMALWPLFRHYQYQLPVPTGAVVAFYKEHGKAVDGNMGCPPGWRYYKDLAGRFPLGAGQGKGLTERTLTDQPSGVETVLLEPRQIPKHSHNYLDIYYSIDRKPALKASRVEVPGKTGSGKHDYNNWGHQFARTTQVSGGGESHENMPPFRVMLFCEFTGQTKVKVSN